jgi:uncharacterized protein YecT (DUF1311 family)
MRRIATALGLLLLMSGPAFAQKEFEPTAAERRTIGDCIDKTAGDSELEQMSKCIGLVADPCPNAPNSNTFTIVACNTAGALKDAQRAWIQFRDAKCGYWEKRYEGGTFASVAAGNCTRIETGRRTLEMRAIFDDLNH